jgi:hypothetical protein
MIILDVFLHALKITALVFVMMVLVDVIDVRTRGTLKRLIRGGVWRQYTIASVLGSTPGCMGSFMNVTLYMHGFLTFGAIVAGMVATSGDEAFVMLAEFPLEALALFGILFALALPLGWLADRLARRFNFTPCQDCDLHQIHPEESHPGHYLKEHIWHHILKKHIWKVFLWTLLALLVVQLGLGQLGMESLVRENMALVLLLSVLIGLIPESGPNLIFVMMFADGMVPFSVLLASSISQDGHGMLPLLSYTVRDSVLIKLYKASAALLIGGSVYLLGW